MRNISKFRKVLETRNCLRVADHIVKHFWSVFLKPRQSVLCIRWFFINFHHLEKLLQTTKKTKGNSREFCLNSHELSTRKFLAFRFFCFIPLPLFTRPEGHPIRQFLREWFEQVVNYPKSEQFTYLLCFKSIFGVVSSGPALGPKFHNPPFSNLLQRFYPFRRKI